MAEDGQVEGFAPKAEPSIAELMDPVALEARLKEARARRAEVLARRETERASEADDSLVERSVATRAGPAVAFAPHRPAWLDDTQAAADEAEAPALRSPTNRVRPVLLPRSGAEAKTAPGEHPPLVAPLGAAAASEDGYLSAPNARRRASPAVLLFLAGLGLGAAAVAIALRPSADDASGPQTVAQAVPPADPGPASTAPVPETAPDPVAAEAPPPVAVTTAIAPTAEEPRISSVAAPAPLAAPASDPSPAPMDPPGEAIGTLLTAETPVPRPAKLTPVSLVAPASVALPRKVTIHYPRSAQALATSVREKLQASGVADVDVLQIGYPIARSNVRFYHGADEAAAAGTSELLVDTLGGPLEERDFTNYPTPTVTGRIEIWLAGEPARTATARQAKPSTPQVDAGPADAPTDQVREVQRILLDRLRTNP